MHLSQMNDLARGSQPSTARDVRLNDINLPALDQCPKPPFGSFLFSTGDENIYGIGHLGITVIIFGMQQFLDEIWAIRSQATNQIDRFFGCSPNIPTSVDQQVDVISQRASGALHQ